MASFFAGFRTAAALLTAVILFSATEGHAAGYYNLPSSAPQCIGYGVGPGYHANLLLGRAYRAPTAAKVVRRMPAAFHPAMAPPVMIDFGGMSAWQPMIEYPASNH